MKTTHLIMQHVNGSQFKSVNRNQLSLGELIMQLYRDPERKSVMRMVYELVYLTFKFRTIPRHYFSRFLFKQDRVNIDDYYPSKVLYDLKPHFNERGATETLENKLFFDFFFRQFNIPLPAILMYNHHHLFVVDSKKIEVHTVPEFVQLLEKVFTDKGINDSMFVKRTYGTYGGNKVFKLLYSQLQSNAPEVTELFNEVVKSGYIFQETVKQHPEMNRLNSSCLNTLRLDTFINADGKIENICANLRTSVTGSHVDNITSGGCAIVVDIATGRLESDGHMSLKGGGMNLPHEHPLSHVVFHDFTIPFFKEAKELVRNAAECIPALRLVGWDVAISETGPVLIEGNSDYDLAGTDMSAHGAKSHPVFRKVLKEVELL
jgi:hypothetical protein